MITTDMHVHSCFSSDCEAPVEAMLEEAKKRGFSSFYLTDHMDYDYPENEEGLDFLFEPEEYFKALEGMEKKYGGSLRIYPSIELGLKPELKEDYQKLIDSYPFDFVIGSTHLIKNQDPYYPDFWLNRREEEVIASYFEQVLENLRAFPKFNSLGHLDYIIRYAPSKKTDYHYATYQDYLEEILKLLIQKGIALEVNTAGYVKGLGQPNPCTEVLERYYSLGGELITIGSDAHKPSDYAYGFPKVEELLKKLGFRYYTVYQGQKPKPLPL